jgi:hypothetical protein
MTRPIPVALHHTCFLVRDLEGAAQQYGRCTRDWSWNIWTIVPASAGCADR